MSGSETTKLCCVGVSLWFVFKFGQIIVMAFLFTASMRSSTDDTAPALLCFGLEN